MNYYRIDILTGKLVDSSTLSNIYTSTLSLFTSKFVISLSYTIFTGWYGKSTVSALAHEVVILIAIFTGQFFWQHQDKGSRIWECITIFKAYTTINSLLISRDFSRFHADFLENAFRAEEVLTLQQSCGKISKSLKSVKFHRFYPFILFVSLMFFWLVTVSPNYKSRKVS